MTTENAVLRSLRQLLVTANIPGSLILITTIMEALRPSETSVLTRVTRRNIIEEGTLHSCGLFDVRTVHSPGQN
jgi:hypothetical protein